MKWVVPRLLLVLKISLLITELAKLKVFLIQYSSTGSNKKDNKVLFKIKDILYNAGNYYSSDGSYPTVLAGQLIKLPKQMYIILVEIH